MHGTMNIKNYTKDFRSFVRAFRSRPSQQNMADGPSG